MYLNIVAVHAYYDYYMLLNAGRRNARRAEKSIYLHRSYRYIYYDGNWKM